MWFLRGNVWAGSSFCWYDSKFEVYNEYGAGGIKYLPNDCSQGNWMRWFFCKYGVNVHNYRRWFVKDLH
jgi:hypothetical protein